MYVVGVNNSGSCKPYVNNGIICFMKFRLMLTYFKPSFNLF